PAAFASHIFDGLQRCHSLFVSREREAMTVGTAPGPLLPGPVRGTQFHPRGPPLRRLTTHTDHRHRLARAGVGRSAVSSKTFDRLDGAWARGAALPERKRAQPGGPRGHGEDTNPSATAEEQAPLLRIIHRRGPALPRRQRRSSTDFSSSLTVASDEGPLLARQQFVAHLFRSHPGPSLVAVRER